MMNIYERIVESILQDLRGRSGFDHLIESIKNSDVETYYEIKLDLIQIIKYHINNLFEMEIHN